MLLAISSLEVNVHQIVWCKFKLAEDLALYSYFLRIPNYAGYFTKPGNKNTAPSVQGIQSKLIVTQPVKIIDK